MFHVLPELGVCLPCHFVAVTQLTLGEVKLLGGLRLYGNFYHGNTVSENRQGITGFIEETLNNADDSNQLHVCVSDIPLVEQMLKDKASDLILSGHLYVSPSETLYSMLLRFGYVTCENKT